MLLFRNIYIERDYEITLILQSLFYVFLLTNQTIYTLEYNSLLYDSYKVFRK